MDEEMQRYRVEQARAYLESITSIHKQLGALEARARELRERASGVKGIAYDRDLVRTSPYGDAIPDAIADLEKIAGKAEEKAVELAEMVDECSTALESLGGWKSALLDLHYLGCVPLVKIGTMDEWKHNRQYMSLLHLQALDSFYDHMPHHRRDPIHRAV